MENQPIICFFCLSKDLRCTSKYIFFKEPLLLDILSDGSRAVDGKMFLESNASSIPGTYFRLGYIKVPRIEEAFDSRNLLPSNALDPK